MIMSKRRRTWEHACDAVTAAMRAIDCVPADARWRLSWLERRGGRDLRLRRYTASDAEAMRWAQAHGVAIRVPREAVRVLAGEVVIAVPSAVRTELPDAVGAPAAPFDVRARAAGEAGGDQP